MINLSGMRFVVTGVADQHSIAWAITQAVIACGGSVILNCHPQMVSRVRKFAEPLGITDIYSCDVDVHRDDEKSIARACEAYGMKADSVKEYSIERCFERNARHAPLQGMVHSIAFSDRNELKGPFTDVTLANFEKTMRISCWSFIEMAKLGKHLLQQGGSILTLTFDAADGTYPHYNVMGPAKAALNASVIYLAADLGEVGIRVNAISASPENTISARGISQFRAIGAFAEALSPLGCRATTECIGRTAAFLLSPDSKYITAQIIKVDGGSGTTIMPQPRNARRMAEAMTFIADLYDKNKS